MFNKKLGVWDSKYVIILHSPLTGHVRTEHAHCQFCDFRLKSPSISETVRDRPMVTMERKSLVANRYVSVPMTLCDL